MLGSVKFSTFALHNPLHELTHLIIFNKTYNEKNLIDYQRCTV
jgi:hypothetical protein